MTSHSLRFTAVVFLSFVLFAAAFSADTQTQPERGKKLFQQHCYICHQANGQGTTGVFPPLAKSDFLMADKARAIRILCEGISQEITVNGVKYNGTMPPSTLNDAEVADVLTYARNEWGNSGDAVSAEEVKSIRTTTKFKTYEELVRASGFAPLPKAPEGFTLREVVRLPDNPTRLASDGAGKVLYVLCNNGNVWRVDVAAGTFRLLLRGERYLDKKLGGPSCLGMVLDAQRRLYIVVNQRNEAVTPVTCEVTIFRTTDVLDGDPFDPQPWLHASYPWGIGPFNHCVNHIAFGPDGFLYVNSGSRTDGNEEGKDARYSKEGETPLTACMWRLDPKAAKPEIEIFARGLRNSFGFCWDDAGHLLATENGPDYDAPEELNVIEKGRHYGFPFQFSDWTKKPYAYTPDAPAGLAFTRPVANLGPAGKAGDGPLYTFHPHSSPSGIVFLGNDFPEGWRGTFLIGRFGNWLKTPDDVGFDMLQARLRKTATGWEATMTTALAPLARY
ncbi:MAG: PQQ-dependent sugar dehydrogenase [Verrucomicrobia bacterium]|nr:PQQ-dependent sugar dehydrogenase [Verrucomicrobiota bacterium]